MTYNKPAFFDDFVYSVQRCDLCERMCDRKKVLSRINGNINSKVMFVAEAPGRLGAECTGIPLYGDRTGENFEMLLSNIGWQRDDVFITNAILCNPQDEDGNNATPTAREISNCSYFLSMTIELINPEIVVTLGIKALEAIKNIAQHDYTLKDHVASLQPWNKRFLFPLYHMSPRAAIHRSMIQQRADFIKLSHLATPSEGLKKKNTTSQKNVSLNSNIRLVDMIATIIAEQKIVSFFKLTKLLYLIDLFHLQETGESMSGGIYLRMQEGPWIPSLKNIISDYNHEMFEVHYVARKPILESLESDYQTSLSLQEINFIRTNVQKFHDTDDTGIKIVVYHTKPMQYILRQEKLSRNMLKTPVLYKNCTVLDIDEKRHTPPTPRTVDPTPPTPDV